MDIPLGGPESLGYIDIAVQPIYDPSNNELVSFGIDSELLSAMHASVSVVLGQSRQINGFRELIGLDSSPGRWVPDAAHREAQLERTHRAMTDTLRVGVANGNHFLELTPSDAYNAADMILLLGKDAHNTAVYQAALEARYPVPKLTRPVPPVRQTRRNVKQYNAELAAYSTAYEHAEANRQKREQGMLVLDVAARILQYRTAQQGETAPAQLTAEVAESPVQAAAPTNGLHDAIRDRLGRRLFDVSSAPNAALSSNFANPDLTPRQRQEALQAESMAPAGSTAHAAGMLVLALANRLELLMGKEAKSRDLDAIGNLLLQITMLRPHVTSPDGTLRPGQPPLDLVGELENHELLWTRYDPSELVKIGPKDNDPQVPISMLARAAHDLQARLLNEAQAA